MDKKNYKIICYLTGAIFAILTLRSVNDLIYIFKNIDSYSDYGINVVPGVIACIIAIIGWLLISVSMFTGIYPLATVGAGLYAVSRLRGVITDGYFALIIVFIAYGVFAVATLQGKKALKFGLISVCIDLLYVIVDRIITYNSWSIFSAIASTEFFLYSMPMILACMVLQNAPQTQTAKIKQPAIAQKTDNRIEELTKLKDLLDTGVISQEEFDAKKKQILGV